MTDEHRLHLYEVVQSFVDKKIDVTPDDLVHDSVACAVSFMAIERAAFPASTFKPSNEASTYYVRKALRERTDLWKQVYIPAPGDAIISATGFGRNKKPDGSLVIPNGHVGYLLLNNRIASNTSKTGIFEANYALDFWKRRWQELGGYHVEFYRRIKA